MPTIKLGMPHNPYVQGVLAIIVLSMIVGAYMLVPQFAYGVNVGAATLLGAVAWTLTATIFGVPCFWPITIISHGGIFIFGYLYRRRIEKHRREVTQEEIQEVYGTGKTFKEPAAPPAPIPT